MTRLQSVFGGALTVAFAATAAAASPAAAGTVEAVRAAGQLGCAVIGEEQDYNKEDLHGGIDALGAEICKAVGIAVLGEAAKVRIAAAPAEKEAFEELHARKVELIVGVTPDATMAWHHDVAFGPPVFYDRLTFMVAKQSGITKMADLAGKAVCYVLGTQNEAIVQATFKAQNIKYLPMPFEEEGEMDDALIGGHCAAVAADFSKLGEARATFWEHASDFVILPDRLNLDPAVVAYRPDDARWAHIVDWTVYALQEAEILGVTRQNARRLHGSDDPRIQRLTGEDWATARALGLPKDWAVRVIDALGNYGEMYDRTVGLHSELKLPRDLNVPWTEGGLIAPYPVR